MDLYIPMDLIICNCCHIHSVIMYYDFQGAISNILNMYIRWIWNQVFISFSMVLKQVLQQLGSEKKENKHLLNIYNVPCTLVRIFTYLISFNFHNRAERQVLFLFSSVKKLRLRDVKKLAQDHVTNEWQTFIQT